PTAVTPSASTSGWRPPTGSGCAPDVEPNNSVERCPVPLERIGSVAGGGGQVAQAKGHKSCQQGEGCGEKYRARPADDIVDQTTEPPEETGAHVVGQGVERHRLGAPVGRLETDPGRGGGVCGEERKSQHQQGNEQDRRAVVNKPPSPMSMSRVAAVRTL